MFCMFDGEGGLCLIKDLMYMLTNGKIFLESSPIGAQWGIRFDIFNQTDEYKVVMYS